MLIHNPTETEMKGFNIGDSIIFLNSIFMVHGGEDHLGIWIGLFGLETKVGQGFRMKKARGGNLHRVEEEVNWVSLE